MATLERPYADLVKDLASALAAAHVKLHGRKDNLD